MSHPEQSYRWTWNLASPATALWPLVSNTDRFNRDCGYPPVVEVPRTGPHSTTSEQGPRRLRAAVAGMVIEWDEQAFEWIEPRRFIVERVYHRGPVARMIVTCELADRDGGGTTLTYTVRVTPSGWLGRLTLPLAFEHRIRRVTEQVFRRYDAIATGSRAPIRPRSRPQLTRGAEQRLDAIVRSLVHDVGLSAAHVQRLRDHVASADDPGVARMRPYVLAKEWAAPRRDTLHLFLHATRAGLLNFSWDLICPHCRGPQRSTAELSDARQQAHCDSCHIDFTVNFDQSVELTFSPNASIRAVPRSEYCVGGPQITPHIVAQQRLAPHEQRTLTLVAAPGRFRARSRPAPAQTVFRVDPEGGSALRIDAATATPDEPALAPGGELTLVNDSDAAQLLIVEHLAWTDDATSAAEVTSLQLFRDLFSREVLRPGEQIAVGSMTLVFTDLKNSTELYRQIGDAPAFGRVLTHFEILKTAVAAEGGAIVKTMGDAVMAVFPQPAAAVRAVVQGHRWLAKPADFPLPPGSTIPPGTLQPFALKASVHTGPCLAINQNDRLDYFGSTVNLAARLCGQCTGSDIVLSDAAFNDPEVRAYLAAAEAPSHRPERVTVRGFANVEFIIHRLSDLSK